MNTRYSDKRSLSVRIASVIGKVFILGIAGIFTAFPFIWMIVSSLKTKAEIMNSSVFLPASPQWSNITYVLFRSPIPKYMWNSTWVALVIVGLQIVSGAMLAYALVFLNSGRTRYCLRWSWLRICCRSRQHTYRAISSCPTGTC